MNKTTVLFFFSLMTSIHAQTGFNTDSSVLRDPTGYKLRSGDEITVHVRGEPDCTAEGFVNSIGNIDLVYIGEVMLGGLNLKDAEKKIIDSYKEKLIFRNPSVKIVIRKHSERVVFLSGAFNKTGPYVFPPEVEAMNIVEVISRAGGFNAIARKNRVYVTRTFYTMNGKERETKTFEIDVEGISNGSIRDASARPKFWIYPGDRLEVPERLI